MGVAVRIEHKPASYWVRLPLTCFHFSNAPIRTTCAKKRNFLEMHDGCSATNGFIQASQVSNETA